MQDRGSNAFALASLEPNLSSAPAPARLDPGCMYRKNESTSSNRAQRETPCHKDRCCCPEGV